MVTLLLGVACMKVYMYLCYIIFLCMKVCLCYIICLYVCMNEDVYTLYVYMQTCCWLQEVQVYVYRCHA